MVARNEGRIDRAHRGLPLGGGLRLIRDALAPAHRPFVEDCGIGELRPCTVVVAIAGGIAEAAERQRKIGVVFRHRIEQVLHQRLVAVARGEQADLLTQPRLIGGR